MLTGFNYWCTCLAVGLLLWIGVSNAHHLPSNTHIKTTTRPGHLYVAVVDDLVTIQANTISLKDLLKEITHQSHMTMVGHHSLNKPITLEVLQSPLSVVLARILRGENYVLRYARRRGPTSAKTSGKLWIYPGVSTDSSPDELEKQRYVIRTKSGNTTTELDTEKFIAASQALTDTDDKSRIEAVHRLADIGSEQAAITLISALSDSSAIVRIEAVDALGSIGGVTDIPALKLALRDIDSKVREAAIEALADVGGDEAARALNATLKDSDVSIRKKTVDTLVDIGGTAAIQVLQQALSDQDRRVRGAVISALRDIGGDGAALALASALHDKDTSLKLEAIEALGEIGGKAATGILELVVVEDNGDVSAAAQRQLKLPTKQ